VTKRPVKRIERGRGGEVSDEKDCEEELGLGAEAEMCALWCCAGGRGKPITSPLDGEARIDHPLGSPRRRRGRGREGTLTLAWRWTRELRVNAGLTLRTFVCRLVLCWGKGEHPSHTCRRRFASSRLVWIAA
jgi:hypothetical protein